MNRFETLESRRLCAVDLVAGLTGPAGTINLLPGNKTGQSVVVTVANRGDQEANVGFQVELYLSLDKTFDPTVDLRLDDGAVATVPAGGSQSYTLPVEYGNATAPGGAYYLLAVADTDGTYANSVFAGTSYFESDTANNVAVSRRPAVLIANALTSNSVQGTGRADRIGVSQANGVLTVAVNGTLYSRNVSDVGVNALVLSGGGGADRIVVDPSVTVPVQLFGGNGNDTLVGGSGNDRVGGGGGKDRIYGGDGDDILDGAGANDVLDGGAGDDLIYGGRLNDVLIGGTGVDSLYGNSGDDVFYSRDGVADRLFGDSGTDTANYDRADARDAIESFFTA